MATYNGNTVKINLTGVGEREYYATGAFSWATKGATSYKLEVVVGIHKSSDWYNSPLSGSVAATGQTTKTFSGNTGADKAGTTATLKTYTFTWDRTTADADKKVTVKVSRVYNGTTYTSTLSHTVTVPALASYTVGYNANGGSGSMSSQPKWYGKSLTLRTNAYTRTGYTFSKFNTKSDGSGTSYSSGGTYTANAAATMYARWTAKTYTVAFNANGGTGAPASQTKTYDKSLTLTTTKPTRTNYVFKNWNTAANGSGTSYASGGTFSTNITTTTTLYAQWYAPRTVNFNANGGTGAPSAKTKVHGQNLALTDTPPTRAGYTFQGWATSTGNVIVVAPNGSYTGNNTGSTPDSVTLYAVWKPVLTLTATATRYSDAAHTVEDDEGTYAVVECAWTSPVATHPSASVSPSPGTSSISGAADGTTGTLTVELTGASADETYDVTFAMSLVASNVANGYQAASVSTVGKVLSAIYILDFKEDTSAGILAPADEDYMLNVGGLFRFTHNGNVDFPETDPGFVLKNTNASEPTVTHWCMTMTGHGNFRLDSSSDGGVTWTNGVRYFLYSDTPDVVATNSASAIVTAASGTTITGALFVRWGRVAQLQINFTRSSDLSVVASGNIADVTVATLKAGFRPYYGTSAAHSYGDNAGQVWYAIGSDGVITITACESTGAARKIAADTTFNIRAVYLLA